MKKVKYGIMLLLLVQGALLHAEFWPEFRDFAKQKNWNRMERVLKNNRNKITDIDRIMCRYGVVEFLRGEDTIRGFELLKNYNINPNAQSLYDAFYKSQPDNVIDYLLAQGIQEKSVDTLKQALKFRRFNYIQRLLSMVENTNLDKRTTRANWTYSPEDWKTEFSWTALIWAVQAEHFDTVKRLVEQGANVNLRAEDGTTAASLAYDNGLVDIYDYLKANGARDFEPRQTAQQPAAPSSTTNVYVQPSAPAQSSTPQPRGSIYVVTVYYKDKNGKQTSTFQTVTASSASEAEKLAQEQWARDIFVGPSAGNTFIRAAAPMGSR